MPSVFLFDSLLTITQTAVALVLAVLLLYYHRAFGRPSLRLWAASFAALALHLPSAWFGMHSGIDGFDAPAGLRLGVAVLSQVTLYCHLALAVLGARAALRDATPDDPVPRQLLAVAIVIGVVVALAWANTPGAIVPRVYLRVGLRYLAGGACFIGIAIALWHRQQREGAGIRVAAAGLGLYGMQLLHVCVVYLWNMHHAGALPWSDQLGVLNLATEMFAGFGLLIWLLEDERNRTQRIDQALKRLRDFDPVTGFPNRRRLLADLSGLLRQSNQRTALLTMRFDQADTLSASHGIVATETLMAEAASRLEQHQRPGWPRPARLSETRLVQPVPRVAGNAELTAVANDLLATMRVPFYLNGQELSLSASVGIAISPDDSDGAEGLIAAAVAACQRAHDLGGNRFQYFSSEMNTLALTKLGLLGELRQAFARGELLLHYQPLVAVDGNRLCGVEALARWQHPQRGLLLPEMFVDELAQLGLIEELDRLVLEQACREACLWQHRHGSEISVSVNISTGSFQRLRFPDLVRRQLQETGLAPSRLELEIVESGTLGDAAHTIRTLERLRALGVRVTLDDFGTGYSSLAYLRELPVDCLKIDRSFVANVLDSPRDAAIVAATIALAHSLGLEVVAEGIETEAQLAWFRHQQADRLQGFLFSPPLDSSGLHRLLTRREQSLVRAPATGEGL